jgi:ABC-type antimicrobial peptide transport system permease subunit
VEGIAGIALLVGDIGITNMMLTSVAGRLLSLAVPQSTAAPSREGAEPPALSSAGGRSVD